MRLSPNLDPPAPLTFLPLHLLRYSLPPMFELDAMNELMGGVRVIIATLSMLSSHNLMVNSFFTTFPMGALLVDEASQIRLDELRHIFNRFRKTLDCVAFFGDERQREPRTLIPEKIWILRVPFSSSFRSRAIQLGPSPANPIRLPTPAPQGRRVLPEHRVSVHPALFTRRAQLTAPP